MCEDDTQSIDISPSQVSLDEQRETSEADNFTPSTKGESLLKKTGRGILKCKHMSTTEASAISSSRPTERITRISSGAIRMKTVRDMCESAIVNRNCSHGVLPLSTCASQNSLKKRRKRGSVDYRIFRGTVDSPVSETDTIKSKKSKTLRISSESDRKANAYRLTNGRGVSSLKRQYREHNAAEIIVDKLCAGSESINAVDSWKNGFDDIESNFFGSCDDSGDVESESIIRNISDAKCFKINSESASADDAVSHEAVVAGSHSLQEFVPSVAVTDRQEICVTHSKFTASCSSGSSKRLSVQGANSKLNKSTHKRQKLGPRSRQNFRCDMCKLRFFESRDELQIHLECHDGGPGDPEYYRCRLCEYSSPMWNRVLSHIVVHSEYKARLVETRSAHNLLGKFTCPKCEQCFERKVNMQNHVKKVHSKESHTCDQCGITLHEVDRKTFIRHQEKCRNVTIQCSHCQYATNVRSNMQKHMKVHNGEGLTCNICSSVFPTRQRFQVHLLTHQVDRPRYECEYCGMMFLSEDSVKKHCVRFHENAQRSIACPHCQYVAKIKSDLKKHIRAVHEKKIKCSDCPFSTNSEHAFEQHRLLHSADRIFGCSVPNCFYRASSAKQMSLHVVGVHQTVGQHQCPICHKYYRKKTHLLRHLVSHTGDRPYACQECGQTFFSHSSYYRHRRRFGHDENREGVASVPQNITIQYLDEAAGKDDTVAADEDLSKAGTSESPDVQTTPDSIRMFTATVYEHVLQSFVPKADLNDLDRTGQELLRKTCCKGPDSLITCVVEVKSDIDISHQAYLTSPKHCTDEQQDVP